MSEATIPWIKSEYSPHNGDKIIELLKEVSTWRHQTSLRGRDKKYDFNQGCYGNPDSKVIIIPEIANTNGLDEILSYNILSEDLWKTAWYGVGRAPQILRDGLITSGFIPPFCEHQPWKWKCWITNFVKCSEDSEKWDNMSIKQKDTYLLKSAEYLMKEIMIISPHCIVFVGNNSRLYYKRSRLEEKLRQQKPDYKPFVTTIEHYSARGSKDSLRKDYIRKFSEIHDKFISD
jgi:hypothetical protein